MIYLRKVFWQDLPLYYEKYPNLSIFQYRLLMDHQAAFSRWCEMSKNIRKEQHKILHQAGGAPSVLLKEIEGLGEMFLSMKVVPNTFVAPTGFRKSALPGSRFFSRLEWVGDGTTVPPQHEIYEEPDCDLFADREGRTVPLLILCDARELNKETSRSLYGVWGVMDNMQKNHTLSHAETQATLAKVLQKIDGLEERFFYCHRQRWHQQRHAESLPPLVNHDDVETPEPPLGKRYRVEHLWKMEDMTLQDVYDEWTGAVPLGLGLEEVSLKKLEENK